MTGDERIKIASLQKSFKLRCIPSAGFGFKAPLSLETHFGVSDPKVRVEMANQRKQSSEAAVRKIRRLTWPMKSGNRVYK